MKTAAEAMAATKAQEVANRERELQWYRDVLKETIDAGISASMMSSNVTIHTERVNQVDFDLVVKEVLDLGYTVRVIHSTELDKSRYTGVPDSIKIAVAENLVPKGYFIGMNEHINPPFAIRVYISWD